MEQAFSVNSGCGTVEAAWYSVAEGVLTMHGEDGKPIGHQTYRLRPDEDPRKAAARLAKARWLYTRGGDFNRSLNYPPLGVV